MLITEVRYNPVLIHSHDSEMISRDVTCHPFSDPGGAAYLVHVVSRICEHTLFKDVNDKDSNKLLFMRTQDTGDIANVRVHIHVHF